MDQCLECKSQINDQDEYCEKCLDRLLKDEQYHVEQLGHDLRALQDKYKKITDDLQKMDSQISKKESKASIVEKERASEQEIVDLDKKEKEQNERLAQLKSDILVLENNEESLWEQINKFQKKLHQLFENGQKADNTLDQLNFELERLNKIDIVNDLFRISVQDDVALLNGMVVGKKNDQQIDWDDMNAALGHLCIIAGYLMKKFAYTYQRIERIEFNGSSSRIEVKNKNVLSLFVNSKTPSQREEDEFNEAFLTLFVEFSLFCDYLQRADILKKRKIQLNLPFKFNDLMISDKSMNLKHYTTQKWDNWTEAVKRFFANVKSVISMNSQFDLAIQQEEFTNQTN